MNKRDLLGIGGAAALGLALVALPASSARQQKPDDSKIACLQQKIEELQAKLQSQLSIRQDEEAQLDDADGLEERAQALALENQDPAQIEVRPEIAGDDLNIVIGDDGSSWLGVETHDVVTEINRQRVEGAAQFRRMIREIPAGRTIQLTVWRDGRTQTISATLGKSEERRHAMKMAMPRPGTFAFRVPEIPDIPSMEWNGNMLFGGGPRLGIDAEDLSGQLGTFFGAPDGEGILVREVNSGSPAEKAGVKAGDVITSLNGERIRTVGELREKLSAKRDEKDRTVKLGVLRNKNAMTLTVELPDQAARAKRVISRRTNI